MSEEGIEISKGNEKVRILFEHAWKYFELHAKQRIALFRFYTGFFGLFAIAAGYLLVRFNYGGKSAEFGGFLLSIISIVIAIIFWLLDNRNRTLIHLGEEAFWKHIN